MPVHSTVLLAFDGSGIDGSLFTDVTDFARDTKWLNTPIALWTNAGLGVFAVLMVVAWWNARRRDSRAMASALSVPVAVGFTFAVAEVIKKMVTEVRPCYSMPHDYFVAACPVRTDYAFPSGHSTTAFATVAALWLVDRRLSAVAALFGLFEGFTRVYLGAHYPHDVLGSVILSLPVGMLTGWVAGRILVPVVERLRTGALQPVLSARTGSHAVR
jgi:membrane-associated phospholipid phosphatase